jgi:hypothetical protein
MNDSITWATVISPRSLEMPRLPRSAGRTLLGNEVRSFSPTEFAQTLEKGRSGG